MAFGRTCWKNDELQMGQSKVQIEHLEKIKGDQQDGGMVLRRQQV